MPQSVKLVSVATVVPPYVLEQRDVAAAAHRTFALRFADFERLARVFKTSGIHRRYAVRPIEWYRTTGLATRRARMRPSRSARTRFGPARRCCCSIPGVARSANREGDLDPALPLQRRPAAGHLGRNCCRRSGATSRESPPTRWRRTSVDCGKRLRRTLPLRPSWSLKWAATNWCLDRDRHGDRGSYRVP